jgi:hypothetical protein
MINNDMSNIYRVLRGIRKWGEPDRVQCLAEHPKEVSMANTAILSG